MLKKIITIFLFLLVSCSTFLYAEESQELPENIGKYKGNSCAWCHSQLEGNMPELVKGWESGVHYDRGIGCADCHGGNSDIYDFEAMDDEDEGFIGAPDREEVPEFCAGCHASSEKMSRYGIPIDQLKTYQNSKHGRRLAENDQNVPVCTTCHGVHGILAVKDKNSPVYYMNLPETCARCHSDKKKMEQYGIPTNQLEKYKGGIHGRIHYGEFPGKKSAIAPTCISCHGKHAERNLQPEAIADMCGQCHIIQTEKFLESPHGKALKEGGRPTCISCHDNHKNLKPSVDMFIGTTKGSCGECHDDRSKAIAYGIAMKKEIDNTHQIIKEAKKGIAEMEEGRYNVDDLNGLLIEAKTHIHINHAVTHALDLEQVGEHMNQAGIIAQKVIDKYIEYKAELVSRYKFYIFAMIMVILAAILIYTKLLIVRAEDKENEKKHK